MREGVHRSGDDGSNLSGRSSDDDGDGGSDDEGGIGGGDNQGDVEIDVFWIQPLRASRPGQKVSFINVLLGSLGSLLGF
ncbi:hypothetical protein RJT34_32327 [Clitoria ternatea]|uniref:Uncharacterized protein n=1 Tax=Clitoria ternatea TaxID=43366 RepID=A0AAN9EW77_CLITE